VISEELDIIDCRCRSLLRAQQDREMLIYQVSCEPRGKLSKFSCYRYNEGVRR
jgi:hypothetical protein